MMIRPRRTKMSYKSRFVFNDGMYFLDCKRYLTDEDTRLLVPVCRLLISCAQGADSSCCQILKDVLQHLINLYNKSSVVSSGFLYNNSLLKAKMFCLILKFITSSLTIAVNMQFYIYCWKI
jgi:hypothetical protein